jgi:hypothetical protein
MHANTIFKYAGELYHVQKLRGSMISTLICHVITKELKIILVPHSFTNK